MALTADVPQIARRPRDESTRSLARFVRPSYWAAWAVIPWFRFTACLPWQFAIRLHVGIGRVFWLLMRRHRRMVERNIRLCFPDLQRPAMRRLVRRHFENLGAAHAETAFAWFGKVDESLAPFSIEGEEHIRAALAEGHGVILYTAHFTPFEICAPILKQRFPLFAFMFHRRNNALLHDVQRRGRQYSGHLCFPSNDVRAMLRALRHNAVVWHAPDRHFSGRPKTVLPLFGIPSDVSTATCSIARASGAAIIPFSYRRLPGKAGYALCFEPALETNREDEIGCTRQLVQVLERFIRQCPEQYAWTRHFMKRRGSRLPVLPRRQALGQRQPQTSVARSGLFAAARSSLVAILGVALFITAFDNDAFFRSAFSASAESGHQFGILLSMFMLVFATLVVVLSLVPGKRSFRLVSAVLLVIAAMVGYFSSYYGIVIDPSMIRNVMETDVREASPLITPAFLMHVAAFGLVPAGLVFVLPLGGNGIRRELGIRAVTAFSALMLLSGTLYANFGPVAYFARENHAVRMQINPLYPLYALYRYETRADDRSPPIPDPLNARRVTGAARGEKPILFIFVMGETARADHFALNGYARDTNRFTRAHGIVNFAHVTSCGTSTADSVPCIFSRFGHDDFTHAKFARNETLFQTFGRLGIDVRWRDNSTGCKHICDDASFEDLAGATNPELCHDNVCVDEILLEELARVVDDDSQDHFIVLHQRGSHGPAYYLDSPQYAKVWLPECDSASLQNCDGESLNNAYDNTMVYTDYFLAQTIEALKSQVDRYQTALLYVSDHGESLGEKGLYLHGVPYALAPEEQTHVPMLFWASDDFYASHFIDETCLRRSAGASISHDAVFHSILPLFDIASPVYDRDLDIFADCRSDGVGGRLRLSMHDDAQRAAD